jgi:hypothetical protein
MNIILILIFLVIGFLKGPSMVFSDAVTEQIENFSKMSFSEQRKYLWEIGCHESLIGNVEVLKVIVDKLNTKYLSIEDYSQLTMDERLLIVELVRANACMAWAGGGGKNYSLNGCRIGYRVIGLVSPENGIEAQIACNYALSDYTKEERDEAINLIVNGLKKLVETPNMKEDPRRNYYYFMYGSVLCELNLDCSRGLQVMYEAALDEYREKGVEGFDNELAKNLSTLHSISYNQRNIRGYLIASEIMEELKKAGKVPSGWGDIMGPAEGYTEVMRKVAREWENETQKVPSGSILKELLASATATVPSSVPQLTSVREPAPSVETKSVPEKEPKVVAKPEVPAKPARGITDLNKSLRVVVFIVILVVVVIVGVVIAIMRRGSSGGGKRE